MTCNEAPPWAPLPVSPYQIDGALGAGVETVIMEWGDGKGQTEWNARCRRLFLVMTRWNVITSRLGVRLPNMFEGFTQNIAALTKRTDRRARALEGSGNDSSENEVEVPNFQQFNLGRNSTGSEGRPRRAAFLILTEN